MSRAGTRRKSRPADAPAVAVVIVDDDGDWSSFGDVAAIATECAGAVAASPAWTNARPATVTVALSSDAAVRVLNQRFRGQDKPTNVLSFPAAGPVPTAGPRPLGDIVLAAETLEREADAMAIPRPHHLRHLLVHGLLHLLGHDHQTDAEAEAMEALEIEILAGFGIANPYADGEPQGQHTTP